MKIYFDFLRINEWYKNVTVLIGIVFAIFLLKISFNQISLINSLIVIFLSCLMSSANYALNAIVDRNLDKKHPTKKFRPLPSKKINLTDAFLIMISLLVSSLTISYLLFGINITFFLFLLFVAALFYNIKPIRLKDVPYVDVLSESINNPIRFLIGWFLFANAFPNVLILIIIWTSACFLMTRKRLNELAEFGEKINNYRGTFRYYSKKSLGIAMSFYMLVSLLLIVIII
jgi:4-hydroxybenzoate polyprenyltransferase